MVSPNVQRLARKFLSDHKLSFVLRNWLNYHHVNRDMMNACLALMANKKEPTKGRYLWPFVLIEHYLEHFLLDYISVQELLDQELPKEIAKAK